MKNKKVQNIIRQALKEDIGKKDITTSLCLSDNLVVETTVIAKEKSILCGIEIAQNVFKQVDKRVIFKSLKKDGDFLKKGEKIARISGKALSLLMAERVALNFLAMLSGISTLTKKFIEKTKTTKTKIMDTRKTTPNLRTLEKYAVKTAGALNHRGSLDEAILIKDNHLKAGKFVRHLKFDENKICCLISSIRKKTRLKIEIEVENLKQFKAIANYKPDIIMLDNFSIKETKTAVSLRNKCFPKIILEASGGITLNNVRKVANTGVDFISIGMLTHSPRAIDFSLEIK